MHRRNAFLFLLLALLAWKLARTDWIVSTRYWFYDSDPPPTESVVSPRGCRRVEVVGLWWSPSWTDRRGKCLNPARQETREHAAPGTRCSPSQSLPPDWIPRSL